MDCDSALMFAVMLQTQVLAGACEDIPGSRADSLLR
jgi:hypothetical protein